MEDKVLWGKVLSGLGKLGNYLEFLTKMLGTGLLYLAVIVTIKPQTDFEAIDVLAPYFFVGLVIHGLKYLWMRSWRLN